MFMWKTHEDSTSICFFPVIHPVAGICDDFWICSNFGDLMGLYGDFVGFNVILWWFHGGLMRFNGNLMLIGWTFDGDLMGLQNVI